MDIKDMQTMIKEFVDNNDLEASVVFRILDAVSEMGELSKEVLKNTDYGERDFFVSESLKSEFSDLMFSIICIANSCDIDIEDGLLNILKKYESRIEKSGNAGSGN